jgi:hypothetical protein
MQGENDSIGGRSVLTPVWLRGLPKGTMSQARSTIMPSHKRKTRNDYSLYVEEILKVRWEDTSGLDEGTVKAADKPVFFDTYGICVKDSEKSLVLSSMAPSDGKDKDFRLLTRIPKRCIEEISILEAIE